MRKVGASATPVGEEQPLTEDERRARLQLLAERLFRPDALDRDTLSRIERLSGEEQ